MQETKQLFKEAGVRVRKMHLINLQSIKTYLYGERNPHTVLLTKIDKNIDTKTILPFLFKALKDKNPEIRLMACGLLTTKTFFNEKIMGVLLNVIKNDKYADVRYWALDAICRRGIPNETKVKIASQSLKDGNSKVRDLAFTILSAIENSGAHKLIIKHVPIEKSKKYKFKELTIFQTRQLSNFLSKTDFNKTRTPYLINIVDEKTIEEIPAVLEKIKNKSFLFGITCIILTSGTTSKTKKEKRTLESLKMISDHFILRHVNSRRILRKNILKIILGKPTSLIVPVNIQFPGLIEQITEKEMAIANLMNEVEKRTKKFKKALTLLRKINKSRKLLVASTPNEQKHLYNITKSVLKIKKTRD